ncbi:Bacterioferritin (fragment) [Candidatus Sulfopaludibacter sp. SbA3]
MDREKSIALLNRAVGDELQAVHQYMYFHFHLGDQGFDPLAKLFKRTAIMEMGHVELLAERILFLNGDVEMIPAGAVEKIQDPEAILAKAMAMEDESAKGYNSAAVECGANADAASK